LAAKLKAQAILASTASGAAARLISRFRPPVIIAAVTTQESTYRRLCLSWGVFPILVPRLKNIDEMLGVVKKAAMQAGYLAKGDRLVITAGAPLGATGSTNLIQADVVQ
jgi:pyruvate kinase